MIHDLAQAGTTPDLAVVQEELRKRGQAMTLSDLAALAQEGLAVDLSSRLDLLREAYMRRRVGQTLQAIQTDLAEGLLSGEEIAAKGVALLTNLAAPVEECTTDLWGILNILCLEGIDGQKTEHLSTGLGQLDAMLGGGLRRQTLTVIGGRTSQGKSALAAQIGLNIAMQGKVCLLFSVEMPARAFAHRVIAATCGIEPAAVRLGVSRERWEQMRADLCERFAGVKFFINDDAAMTSAKAAALCRRMKQQHGLDVVVLDYIQRLADVPAPGETPNKLMGRISRAFGVLARQLDCAVILVSQLNRQPEGRRDNEPKLSDLRDSGEIEQDADTCLLIHRKSSEDNGTAEQDKSLVDLIIAKQREGPTGKIRLVWDARAIRFLGREERRG